MNGARARLVETDTAATPQAVRQSWRETVAQTRPFAGPLLPVDIFERVAAAVERYVEGRGPLFAARIAGGHVGDGHGDVLADVAFLCMDLERLGRLDLAQRFLEDYEEFSGLPQPRSLLHHWIAYHAMVCCKLACIRNAQGDPEAAHQARALLDIAFRHAERSRVQLILVGGLPGTGRSTLSRQLGDALDATMLRSDAVRSELAAAHDARGNAATYGALLHRTRMLLEHGESVVIDATWGDRSFRHAARRLAGQTCSDICELRCTAPAARMAEVADPWPSAHTVDTTLDPARSLARALHAVARAGISGTTDLRPSPLSHPAPHHPPSAAAIR